jgi:hypothetical protein
MVSAQELRDDADRCYKLAQLMTFAQDKELFESLGAEADRMAADMETKETTDQAGEITST